MLLTVGLVEMDKTFALVSDLEQYLSENAGLLESTTVTFEVAPDVAWGDIHRVLTAFIEGPLAGEMRFADVRLRPPLKSLVLGVTPLAPTASASGASRAAPGG